MSLKRGEVDSHVASAYFAATRCTVAAASERPSTAQFHHCRRQYIFAPLQAAVRACGFHKLHQQVCGAFGTKAARPN
jgi:hypothetical protein